MKRIGIPLLLAASILAGCSSGPAPEIPPPMPAKLGRASYWYAQPSVASVDSGDYDLLWNTCDYVAHRDLFSMDVEDYREGIMETQPLVSRQFFEFWRPDTGDTHGLIQNSLQATRRTIRFEFTKTTDGFEVTPKVLIEQLAQSTARVTSPLQYERVFEQPLTPPQADETGAQGHYFASRWYAIGRDLAMEKELAQDISDRIK
jgi:hypothetical protein